jgi:hypothetical protein
MTETKSVWLVSSGDYSDYKVHCVCATEEIAKRITEGTKGSWWSSDAFVEERPLCEDLPEVKYVYTLHGEFDWATISFDDREMRTRSLWAFEESEDYSGSARWRWTTYGNRAYLLVEGTDLERVRHIYSDTRAQILAHPAVWLRERSLTGLAGAV